MAEKERGGNAAQRRGQRKWRTKRKSIKKLYFLCFLVPLVECTKPSTLSAYSHNPIQCVEFWVLSWAWERSGGWWWMCVRLCVRANYRENRSTKIRGENFQKTNILASFLCYASVLWEGENVSNIHLVDDDDDDDDTTENSISISIFPLHTLSTIFTISIYSFQFRNLNLWPRTKCWKETWESYTLKRTMIGLFSRGNWADIIGL